MNGLWTKILTLLLSPQMLPDCWVKLVRIQNDIRELGIYIIKAAAID